MAVDVAGILGDALGKNEQLKEKMGC